MKKLAIIGTVFPEPNSTAAGSRMLQLIGLFHLLNYEISFLSTAEKTGFSADLSNWQVHSQQIILNHSSFDEYISQLQPDVVLFDRFMTEEQFGWRVAEQCPNALRILDTEDLHFLRKARETAFKQNRKPEESDLHNDTFKREMAAILRSDLSLIISEYEYQLLTDTFQTDESLLLYLPLFSEPNLPFTEFSERKNFISIGNFLHEPNWHTVLKIKKLWPDIKSHIPEAEIHIYGAYASQKAFQLHHEKDGFLVKGRAESVPVVFEQARVLLAPIPFGAGIKGKLLNAMEHGLPSVTSSTGAEGMHGDLPWNGFICDSDKDFIEKAIALYSSETLWNNAQQNGITLIKNRFTKEAFTATFANRISDNQNSLTDHRRRNFLGQILQHHTVQSTKYLSKWIEEKNKK
ncbi:glycosyltransferase [Chryseobacterium sp. MFBS3-17]|uniref:glycosyltransferase n=1 Tax=Chryseobacterium sp. MFBS3-17 TaxID=2886689 RepID=UPI001D0E31D2|nr:glycosyltransferase [Chryseobacterium sp. MFBS3-17]MCC2591012.1 glycosyltransferase [Chryseobacterium sp. MFBS3-17]